MTCTVQFGDSADADGPGAGALDLSAHGVEQGGEVSNLRLAGAVLKQGFAVSEGRGHQQVFGAGDGDLIEDDVSAAQAILRRTSFQIAVLLRDDCSHLFETADVQVDGTAADGAATGHGDAGNPGTRHEGAEHQGAGSHGLHDFVLGDGV